MKESSKERLATLLMEELLEQLPTREKLRKMFGEMTSQPIDEVIEQLLTDFERTVAEYRLTQFVAKKHGTAKQSAKPLEKQVADVVPVVNGKANLPFIPAVQPAVPEAPSAKMEPVRPEPVGPAPVRLEPELSKRESVTVTIEQTQETARKSESVKAEPIKPSVTSQPTIQEPVQIDAKKPEAETTTVQRPAKKNESNGQPASSIQLTPIKLEFPKIQLTLPDMPELKQEPAPSQIATQPEAKKMATSAPMTKAHEEQLQKLEEMAKKLEEEYAARRAQLQAESARTASEKQELEEKSAETIVATNDEPVETVLVEEEDEEIDSDEGASKHTARARHHFADNEYAYVHGVSRIPEGESPVTEPFMLEEKGIDGHEFAFALDYKGLRYYLSKFSPTEMNVSKAMVLLLNKQESLQCQGAHENVLNDLRGHGILLPFDFGTVVRGRDALLSMIDKNDEDIEEALADVEKTTWWTVTASVLDATIAKIVGTDVQTVGRDRSRDRASYTSTVQGKKFDIKVLERILQREKKIAEAVHTSLSAVAKRADIDTMVGLGSGSSEDWKVVLKASYDVPKRDIAKFNRAITDLQYHHLQYDLMLALAGKKDSLRLRRK